MPHLPLFLSTILVASLGLLTPENLSTAVWPDDDTCPVEPCATTIGHSQLGLCWDDRNEIACEIWQNGSGQRCTTGCMP
ncbi:MAG: hypothetical protein AAGE94_21795 [Acidobacteriota bacterium]